MHFWSMRFVSLGLGVWLGLSGACAPSVDDATFSGDVNECSAAFTCQGAACAGVEYGITCTLNAANAIYDCTCSAGGVRGETFSEAGVCEQDAEGIFTDFDLADASAHAVDDCQFPVTAVAEE